MNNDDRTPTMTDETTDEHLPPPAISSLLEERGTEEQLAALYAALAEAQGSFEPVEKTGRVGFRDRSGNKVSYSYAPMSAIISATSGPLRANGLACIQPFAADLCERSSTIITILSHSGGARLVSRIDFLPDADIKELGGQTTYLRRYARQCLLGVEGEETTEERPTEEQPPPKPRARRTPPTKPPTKPAPSPVVVAIKAQREALGLSQDHLNAISLALHKQAVPGILGDPDKIAQLSDVLSAMTPTDAEAICGDGNIGDVVTRLAEGLGEGQVAK